MSTYMDIADEAAPARKAARPTGFAQVAPAFAFVAIFFIFPVIALLLRSVLEPAFGLGNYAELLGSAT